MKKILSLTFILFLSMLRSQGFTSFTSAGGQDQYVPVVFLLALPDDGNRTFNISRPRIHDNRHWLGHGLASITAVGHGYGSGGNGIRLDNFTYGHETTDNSSKIISFVGRVVVDNGGNNVIVFLRGGTTYYTDGNVIDNDGSYQDVSGAQNFAAVSINDILYNLPKGSYYSNYDITAKNTDFVTTSTGNVGIGINNPKNKLDVNGTIHAKEINIDLQGWADYVFTEDYRLPTLEEVERHIQEKGHLPSIPSQKEVMENGIDLGNNQRALLQKIEELTLYSIEQNKQIKILSERVEKLEKK